MLRTNLRGWGYTTAEADDGESAVALVRETAFDAVICDIRMARMDGLAALEAMLRIRPGLPVFIMTAYASDETMRRAFKCGAYDYFTKPLDLDDVRNQLADVLERARPAGQADREALGAPAGPSAPTGASEPVGGDAFGLLGNSLCMKDLVRLVHTVAPSEATVLIFGESGTGKELVARAIQGASHRADKPFVTVNCAALNASLLESELFGHERGAFTGADKRREGRFRQADGGTLFLDEIGELPLALQAKLLRALQQGEIQRVGSDLPLRVDVRLLAATNRDLRAEVEAGRFREDLFYRLNVIGIEVPPLRERPEDIPVLAASFVRRFAGVNRKTVHGITPQALETLTSYPWPGNVRELENVIERAVILCMGDVVSERELPSTVRANLSPPGAKAAGAAQASDAGGTPQEEPACPAAAAAGQTPDPAANLVGLTLEELERRAILATLREVDDNKSEAARRLGITRATLHNKLKRYTDEDNI